VLQFQFKRILNDTASLKEWQAEFDDFVSDKQKNVHKIKLFLLGVTNHWEMMVAHKYNDKVEFWFLDSKNRDYLEWNEEQIQKFLTEENINREKEGKKVWNTFQLWVNHNAIIDTQITLKLLTDCLLGNKNIFQYLSDSEIEVIDQGFLEKPELKDLYEKYPNIDKQVESLSSEKYKELVHDINEHINAYGEPLYLFLRSQDKVNNMSKEGREKLAKVAGVVLRLVNDKRYKFNLYWIRTYKGVFEHAASLFKF